MIDKTIKIIDEMHILMYFDNFIATKYIGKNYFSLATAISIFAP